MGGGQGSQSVSAADNIMNAAEETSSLALFFFFCAAAKACQITGPGRGREVVKGEGGAESWGKRSLRGLAARICLPKRCHKTNEPST